MGHFLPTERVDRLTRLFDAGYSTEQAARVEGVARKTAQRYRHWWKAEQHRRARDRPRVGRRRGLVRFPPDLWPALKAEALARATAPDELAVDLVRRVLEDGLVDIVLL